MATSQAFWQGPKRGWVESSFDDMALGNGWSLKTLQRTIEELEAKPYIAVARAANQYELTRLKILKYDLEESTSAVDKFGRSGTVGVDCAVDCGADRFDQSAVHSKPASAQSQRDLGAAKKVIEVKKEKKTSYDKAVGCPEETATAPPNVKGWPLRAKGQVKNENIINKILGGHSGGPFREKLDKWKKDYPEFIETVIKAFDSVGWNFGTNWRADDVAEEFVMTAEEVWEKVRHKNLPKSVECSKIIDECQSNEVLWPPSFQEHRDWLREREQ